jgi:Spy/CpxP family protein refolding chaperone
MKRIMMAIMALAILAGVQAQPGQGPRPGGKGIGGRKGNPMMEQLNLTPQQKEQTKKLQEQFRQQMQSLNQNESITVKEQRDRRESLMKEHRQAMEKLLTPEQKNQLGKQKQSRQEIAKHQQAIGLERMKSQLNLTEDQAKAMQKHMENNRKQMEALSNNESLDRTARQEQMKKMREQSKADLEKILTKEQMNQWKDRQQQRGGPRGGMHRPDGPHQGSRWGK